MTTVEDVVWRHAEQFAAIFLVNLAIHSFVALKLCRTAMTNTSQYICFKSLVFSVLLLYAIHFERANAQRDVEYLDRHDIGPVVEYNATSRLFRSLPYLCPNGTGYVFDQRTSLRAFMGCAPLGHRACSSRDSIEILGSCPAGQACCFWRGKYRGCAQSVDQCCHSQICPAGYTCCGDAITSRCCPLSSGQIATNRTTLNETCTSNSTALTSCLPNADAVQCPVAVNATLCERLGTESACNPLPLYCQDVGDCRYGIDSFIDLYTTADTNSTTVRYEDVDYAPVACCPNGGDMCFSLSRKLIGCADPTLNETCCGDRICPDGYQCCQYTVPHRSLAFDVGLGYTYNKIVRNRCCPVGVQCCQHPLDDSSLDQTAVYEADAVFDVPRGTFCGLSRTIGNDTRDCTVHATARAERTFLYMLFNET